MATINDPITATNVATVKAASTAPIATDLALVVSLSPNSAAPAPTGTTTVAGNKTHNAAVPGATNIGTLPAVCNASAPTFTDTFQCALSCTTTGALRSDCSSIAGTATATAAAGVQKVGNVGNAGAIFDAVQGAAAPANLIWTETRLKASDLLVTNTAAVNTGFTVTLPSVASQFHYITSIQIVRATNATATAAGAALTITTTNLPGNPVWTFGNASTAGGTTVLVDFSPTTPLKSSAAGTNTTIVVPGAGAGEILRANVSYYAAL